MTCSLLDESVDNEVADAPRGDLHQIVIPAPFFVADTYLREMYIYEKCMPVRDTYHISHSQVYLL
jgi:hypothetical protein